MDQNDLKTIQITVAGRVFPLKVNKVEEQIALEVEQELNDSISSYQHQYASRDKLDCVLMTLLKFVFEQKRKDKHSDENTGVVADKINRISTLLQDSTD